MANSPRRWAFVIPVAFLVFYVGLHMWGTHSEGYAFLDLTLRKSPEIQQRVGSVQRTRLSFLSGYSEKFVGSDKSTTMTIDVIGNKDTVTVKTSAKKINGVWSVSAASIDGTRINLN